MYNVNAFEFDLVPSGLSDVAGQAKVRSGQDEMRKEESKAKAGQI